MEHGSDLLRSVAAQRLNQRHFQVCSLVAWHWKMRNPVEMGVLLEAMHLAVTKPRCSASKLFACFDAGLYFEHWIGSPHLLGFLLHHPKQYRSSVRTVYLLHRLPRIGHPLDLGMYCYSAPAAWWLKCLETPSPKLRTCPFFQLVCYFIISLRPS
jgi:hypothetical protein